MNIAKKFSMAATLVGLGAVSSLAEVKVNDNLSLTGFIDMSTTYNTDTEAGTLSLDQFEVDFLYKYDKLSARADVNYFKADTSLAGVGGTSLVKFEQGYVSYAIGSGAANISVGRFLSVSGYEAAEPTGLFQFSTSKTLVYGGYQNGLNLSYNGGMFALYGALVTNPWNNANSDDDVTNPGFEAQLSLMPTSAITAKFAYVADMAEDSVGGSINKQYMNAWAQFAQGPLTAALEFNYVINYDETKDMGYLAMVNAKFAKNYAVTLRHSAWIEEDQDFLSEVTLSPSVVLTPNWSALLEGRVDLGGKDTAGEDVTPITLAAESIFTF
jgi:hypothetical protein